MDPAIMGSTTFSPGRQCIIQPDTRNIASSCEEMDTCGYAHGYLGVRPIRPTVLRFAQHIQDHAGVILCDIVDG